jgi:hypothetical protein
VLDLASDKPRTEVLENPVMDLLEILRRIEAQAFEFMVERVEHGKTAVRRLQEIVHLRSSLRSAAVAATGSSML